MGSANPEYPSIPEFFEDQEIFVTGGTGFMGKTLIEKILRSCPKVKNIYALIRSKKNKTADERLEVLKNSAIFNRLKREIPQQIDKLVAVDGDVSELELGLSPKAKKMMENVSLIFHAAASVRFDDPLKEAILMNTRGTREVMRFGETLKNLQFCMHVSTTYCNPTRSIIEEKLYPPPGDWQVAIKLAETIDDYTLNVLTDKFTRFHPNTYTYTKALAEQVVNDYRDRLPVIIFRPSIVISSIDEPEPGWLDNFNGPVGLLIACAIGILRTCYANPEQISDYLPCDIAIKAMMITAWRHGVQNRQQIQPKTSDSVEVLNCCTSNARSMKMGEMIDLGRELAKEMPFNEVLWAPGGQITKSRVLNYTRFILYQFLPAFFIDLGLRLSGHKYFLLKLQRRIYTANMALQFFILNQWEFKNDKFMRLCNDLKVVDHAAFAFEDFVNRDVRNYFKTCAHGARKFLLNEKDEDLPKAQKHFMRMHYLDKVVTYLFRFLFIYILLLNWGQHIFFVRNICAAQIVD